MLLITHIYTEQYVRVNQSGSEFTYENMRVCIRTHIRNNGVTELKDELHTNISYFVRYYPVHNE